MIFYSIIVRDNIVSKLGFVKKKTHQQRNGSGEWGEEKYVKHVQCELLGNRFNVHALHYRHLIKDRFQIILINFVVGIQSI